MLNQVYQLIHILLHFPGNGDGLFGKFLDGCQLVLTGLYFLIDFVCGTGDFDNGVSQLFLLIVGGTQGGAEDGFRGIGDLLGNIDNLFCLMLHGQIQGADLHDGIDVFLENLGKLLSSLQKSLIDAAQLRFPGVIGVFQFRDGFHQYCFSFFDCHFISSCLSLEYFSF